MGYSKVHHAEKQRREIAERQSHLVEGENGRPFHPNPRQSHGHNETYSHDGCRCDVCVEGASRYRKDLHRRTKAQRLKPQTKTTTVDPGSVFKF